MKHKFNTIEEVVAYVEKVNVGNKNSIFEFVKRNPHLKADLVNKTSFLDNTYLVQPLSQRLHHFVFGVRDVPVSERGWYLKYRGFGKGYCNTKQQDVRECRWDLLSEEEIGRYIKASTSSIRHKILQNWVISNTKFLDEYHPTIAERTFYVRHGITYPLININTNQLVSNAVRSKIKGHLEFDQKFEAMSREEKILLLKEWLSLKGGKKLSKTQQIKLCMPLINFLKDNTNNISGLKNVTDCAQLAYHVVNNIADLPRCRHCNKQLSATQFNTFLLKYPLTCSIECNNKCIEVIERRLANNSTNNTGYKTNVGKNERYLLNLLSKYNNLTLTLNKQIGPYFFDGVDENQRIVIEIQEKRHAYTKQFEKDKKKIKYAIDKGYRAVVVLDSWLLSSTKQSTNQSHYRKYFQDLSNTAVVEINVANGKVLTQNGWSPFLGTTCNITTKQMFEVVTEDGLSLNCTEDHLLFDKNKKEILTKNLCIGDLIETQNGYSKVCSINPTISTTTTKAYDIIETENNEFFANGIKVHNCVLLDEAAHIETHLLEDFWSSVIPTISSGKKSKILVVSTPKGVGNKFYEIYSGAESGKLKKWKHERIDWWDFPGRDEDWKQEQIELLGSEEKFLQEYNNTFLDNAANAVGAQVIEKFKREKKPPIWTSDDGEYQVFEYPNPKRLYVVGVDVSEGIGRAASVAQILDVTDLQNITQVAVYGSTITEPYHFANKLNIIGKSWGNPPMLIERNNCGAQVIDALYYKHQYEKIVCYSKVSEQDRYNRTRSMGVLSHNNIRFDGIQNMRYWINHLDVVHINDSNTISEFETFVKFPNGVFRKKSDKFFDDRVMALVWALFILESEICEQYFEIVEFDTQHKPLVIKDNGNWEIRSEDYELKDLSITPKVISKPENYIEQNSVSTFTSPELNNLNIEPQVEDDIFDLMSQGYSFFVP